MCWIKRNQNLIGFLDIGIINLPEEMHMKEENVDFQAVVLVFANNCRRKKTNLSQNCNLLVQMKFE